MTFKPSALPTFGRATVGSVVDMKKAKKATVGGLVAAQILARKYGGIIRPRNSQEPYSAEKLLLVSAWGASDMLDLTPNIINYKRVMTIEDCKRFEPGTVKYYVCLVQGSESSRRPLGDTPIACQHLADGKCFDTVEAALEEYNA